MLAVQTATDCAGNASGPLQSAPFGLPEAAASGDVVLNELLFNPRVGAVRFAEIVNRSSKFIDLQGWQIGNLKPNGSVDGAVFSAGPLVLRRPVPSSAAMSPWERSSKNRIRSRRCSSSVSSRA